MWTFAFSLFLTLIFGLANISVLSSVFAKLNVAEGKVNKAFRLLKFVTNLPAPTSVGSVEPICLTKTSETNSVAPSFANPTEAE